MSMLLVCPYVASPDGDPRIPEILMRMQRLEIEQQRAQRASFSTAAALGKQLDESAQWQSDTIMLRHVLRTRWCSCSGLP